MPERAASYVPIDRQAALVDGRELPDRVFGTALEADLSGFTALTEALAGALGEQRGAEELARRLNRMYDGLIDEVHRFGGTVLGFSGDAFTCWLDGDEGGRAAACAQSLQRWLSDHGPSVSAPVLATDAPPIHATPPRMKVALATGHSRRFLVGDPDIQVLEGLAGALVDEMAEVEHHAEPGEIMLAASTRRALRWRVEVDDRGALLGFHDQVEDAAWPALDEDRLALSVVRPWLLPAVFTRLAAGEGDFLAELRPATALFLRFGGIDFESDGSAIERLDRFVRAVQRIVAGYEGALIQLTIGDKGSYLYAAFGAPVAHEDDPARALRAALDLRRLGGAGRRRLVEPVSIGVASGRLRAGAYGGLARRTYGVLGDTVNLAARLMQAAGPGEIVATQRVLRSVGGAFVWSARPDVTVKGKREPVAIGTLRGRRHAGGGEGAGWGIPAGGRAGVGAGWGIPAGGRAGVGAGAPAGGRAEASQPLLGRAGQVSQLEEALDAVEQGQGQLVGVVAEAGMGKTRLVHELMAVAAGRGVAVHQSECPSMGVNGSYVVWRPLWSRLLDVGDRGTVARRQEQLTAAVSRTAPSLLPRLPLLSPLLGFPISDNEFTAALDAKVRKTALEGLLADWLRATVVAPTLVVLEDCHWIDPLSEDLVEVIGRAVRRLPLLMVVTQRPRGEAEGGPLSISRQPHYREVPLPPLSDDDVGVLVEDWLARHGGGVHGAEQWRAVVERAEGNPFYVGELLQYLLDLGPQALDPDRLAELPTGLQSLILSRMDRLDEGPRSALKVASAVGRVFPSDLLAPIHPELGPPEAVRRQLATLERSQFVQQEDDGVAGAVYSFTHAVTQEVAYSTIVGDTRAALHGLIGRELERRAGGDAERQLDELAFHFARSDDDERRRVYVRAAGEAAQARYANRSAIEYYRNILPLLVGADRGAVLVRLGRAEALLGRWDEAAASFTEAYERALQRADLGAQGWAQTEQGELLRKQGRYQEAGACFDAARAKLEAVDDTNGVAEVDHDAATLAAQQGDTALAGERYRQSLAVRRQAGDRRGVARSLNGLGVVAEYEGRLDDASALYREAMDLLTALGDRWGVAALTNNLGMILLLQDRPAAARPLFDRAVAIQREIGDPHMLANFLSNLGDAARESGDGDSARVCYHEGLALARALDERWLITYLLEDIAMLAAQEGRSVQALRLGGAAAHLREVIGAPIPPETAKKLETSLGAARAGLTPAERDEAAAAGAGLSLEAAVEEALAAGNR